MNAFEAIQYKKLDAFLKKISAMWEDGYSLKQKVSIRGKNKKWYFLEIAVYKLKIHIWEMTAELKTNTYLLQCIWNTESFPFCVTNWRSFTGKIKIRYRN